VFDTTGMVLVGSLACLIIWHYIQEQVRPGTNRHDINTKFFRSSDEWSPVTRPHDRWIHRGLIFGSLTVSIIAALAFGSVAWFQWAAGVAAADAIQHVVVFRSRVAGFGSAIWYGVWALVYLSLRGWDLLTSEPSYALVFGFAFIAVFANLGALWLRHRKRSAPRSSATA